MTKDINNRIEDVFEKNPELKEVFVTSDGQIFFKKYLADAHSVKINGRPRPKKLTVETVERKEKIVNKFKEKIK